MSEHNQLRLAMVGVLFLFLMAFVSTVLYLSTPACGTIVSNQTVHSVQDPEEFNLPPANNFQPIGKDPLGNRWTIALPATASETYMQLWTVIVLKDYPSESGIVLLEFDCPNKQSRTRIAAVVKDGKIIDMSKEIAEWKSYAGSSWYSDNVAAPACKSNKNSIADEDIF